MGRRAPGTPPLRGEADPPAAPFSHTRKAGQAQARGKTHIVFPVFDQLRKRGTNGAKLGSRAPGDKHRILPARLSARVSMIDLVRFRFANLANPPQMPGSIPRIFMAARHSCAASAIPAIRHGRVPKLAKRNLVSPRAASHRRQSHARAASMGEASGNKRG